MQFIVLDWSKKGTRYRFTPLLSSLKPRYQKSFQDTITAQFKVKRSSQGIAQMTHQLLDACLCL